MSRFYTVGQVSELLSIPRSSVYDLVRNGRITAVRYGEGRRRCIRVEATALDKFLERHRVPARAETPGERSN